MGTALIRRLYRSPGHNYFGHHGQTAGSHEIEECRELELFAGRGVAGDRFLDFKDNYKGQITFIDQAVVEAVRNHAGRPDLSSGAFRRNVVIERLDLNALIGVRFRLQGVLFEGMQECSPCYWMDRACGVAGCEKVMKGRGGLRCRILENGRLVPGETTWELEQPSLF